MKNNEQQNIDIALIKKDLCYLKKTTEGFESKLTIFINSFNKDKENDRKWIQEHYVSKIEFKPIATFIGRINNFGWAIIFIILGGISSMFLFIKDQFK